MSETSDPSPSRSGSSFESLSGSQSGVPSQVYKLTLAACLLSLTMGMDIGINPGLGFLIRAKFSLNDVETELIISMITAAAIVGASFAWAISDTYGRTKTILAAAAMKVIGTILVMVGYNWVLCLFGRLFAGIGYGLGFSVDSIYVSEIVSSRHRGRFIAYIEFCRKFGILLGIVIVWAFSGSSVANSERWMCAILLLPSIMLFILTFFLPETPRWLVMVGRVDEARQQLSKLVLDTNEVNSSITDMQHEIETSDRSWKNILCPSSPTFRRMVCTVLLAAFLEEMSGIHVIIFYAPFLLQKIGLTYHASATWLTLTVLVMTAFIVLAAFLLDAKGFGRRNMIMASCVGTALACIGLSIAFFFDNVPAVVSMMIMHSAFYSLGLGPGVLLLITETIPLYARAKVVSIAQMVRATASLANAMTFLTAAAAITETAIFGIYAGFMIGGIAWAYFLPKTRGRRLESMHSIYAKN